MDSINEHAGFPFIVANKYNFRSKMKIYFIRKFEMSVVEVGDVLMVGTGEGVASIKELSPSLMHTGEDFTGKPQSKPNPLFKRSYEDSWDLKNHIKQIPMMPDIKDFTNGFNRNVGNYTKAYYSKTEEEKNKIKLEKEVKDLTKNVSKKAKPFGTSKHNKRRLQEFKARVKKRRKKKR